MDGRILFRTSAGKRDGWGNAYRLASFAGYCREHGFRDLHFLVEGPEATVRFLEGKGFPTHRLDDASPACEERFLTAFGPVDHFIVEMLDVSLRRQDMWRKFCGTLTVFDDLLDHRYSADFVVCGQQLPGYGNRDLSAPGTRFLVGYDYFLSRPEFLERPSAPRVHNPAMRRVLVILGGGDYEPAWLKAAKALCAFDPTIEAEFILGHGRHESLAAAITDRLPSATISGGVDDVHQRFLDCDAAIVGAGYTKLEAALTRTPAVMIATQWHQIPLAQEFHAVCGMPSMGYMSYFSVEELVAVLREMASATARREMADRAAEVIDGKGFQRVFNAVFG